jgi:RND family efflux transporter MFP subunit
MNPNRFLLAGLGVAALLGAGCRREATPEAAPTPVRVRAVELHAESSAVRYSAQIEPRQSVDLAFKVGGYVVEVSSRRGADGKPRPVQGGDRVSRGEVLARLRDVDTAAQLHQAEGALAAARASRSKAKADLDRALALDATKSITAPDLDAARAAFDAGEAQVQQAEAQVEQAHIARDDSALKAPMEALVLDRKIESGDLVGPGTVGFVLADLTSVKAVFGVSDSVVKDLKIGDSIPVRSEALVGAEMTGRITAISPAADRQRRVFNVEVTLPNPRGDLKSGMIATVSVGSLAGGAPAEAESVPVVPLSAVVRSHDHPDGYAVLVIEEGGGKPVARSRDVTVGTVFGNLIAVTSGVKPGESVIVTGAALLSDGEAVKIIP